MTTYQPDAVPLDAVLLGDRGAAAVRQVVSHPTRYGAGELFEAQGVSLASTPLTLLRSKYKPGRKLSAVYTWSADDARVATRHAVVTWVLTPRGAWTSLHLSPIDETMPHLQRLSDPRHVASLAASLLGRPVGLPDDARSQIIRYRPGQRHVLVSDLGDGAGAVYVKTDRDRSGAEAVTAATLMTGVFARQGVAARAVEPLGWAPDDAAALWWSAPGTSLSRLLAGPSGAGPPAVTAVGRALRALHDTEPAGALTGGGRNAARDAPAEAVAALGAGAHIATLLPAAGEACTELLSEVVDRLGRLPQEPPAPAHGDFKGDNILVHRGSPTILDLDRMCLAEPALDLGKFLADLAWWSPDERRRGSLAVAFRAGYGPCDALRWQRASLWAVIFELKNAAHRCQVHAPDWEALVGRRVAAAGRQLWSGGPP